MRLPAKATRALPIVILLLGALIPILARSGGVAPPPGEEVAERRVRGRTAGDWRELAAASLESGRYRRALGYIKTAESVEAGTQYAEDLAAIRTARWRSRQIVRARTRLIESEIEHVECDAAGGVLLGYRVAVVLPGESLWSLAEAAAAAERGVLPSELPEPSRDVHRAWDSLTDLNGVRELEVGELVRLALTDEEAAAIADANHRDLERIEHARVALDAGDLDTARRVSEEIAGEFALTTEAFRALHEALGRAVDAENARALTVETLTAAGGFDFVRAESLAVAATRLGADPGLQAAVAAARAAREVDLVARAYDLATSSRGLSRTSQYGELVASLREARGLLAEAEGLSPGAQYEGAAALVADLIGEAEAVRVRDDGVVVVRKPAGTSYTDVSRAAVEWLLGRSLASSGMEFPHHAEKTGDEIAWARFLGDAFAMAEDSGVDFAALLRSDEEDREITLPNPDGYFEQ